MRISRIISTLLIIHVFFIHGMSWTCGDIWRHRFHKNLFLCGDFKGHIYFHEPVGWCTCLSPSVLVSHICLIFQKNGCWHFWHESLSNHWGAWNKPDTQKDLLSPSPWHLSSSPSLVTVETDACLMTDARVTMVTWRKLCHWSTIRHLATDLFKKGVWKHCYNYFI